MLLVVHGDNICKHFFKVQKPLFGGVGGVDDDDYNNNNNKGASGTISKSFRKYVSNIPGKHEVKELQKTVILGTAHVLRKVLM